MSDAERMILIQRMILEAHHFHDSLSPGIPSQTGITLMIVMMTDFLTCHEISDTNLQVFVWPCTVRSCQQVPSVYAVEKFQQLWPK